LETRYSLSPIVTTVPGSIPLPTKTPFTETSSDFEKAAISIISPFSLRASAV
jgi:hypothetical protein